MDKKTFLEELRSSLSVLQETELNDIMDEYEQHIDMKVQSGLDRGGGDCRVWKQEGADSRNSGGLSCES